MKLLLLGFYGVGKTYLKDRKGMIDLTDFGTPSLSTLLTYYNNPDYDIIMADSQWEKVFVNSRLPFYVVIPTPDRKDEFLINYRERYKNGTGGGDDRFCNIIDRNWDEWLDYSRTKIPCEEIIQLEKGEWMADAINYISRQK